MKRADVDFLRPMTDNEIFGNILDTIFGGTESVILLLFFFFFKKKIMASRSQVRFF
jgi:hypothetical protein